MNAKISSPDDVILNAVTAGSWGRGIEFKGRLYKSIPHLTTEWNAKKRGGVMPPRSIQETSSKIFVTGDEKIQAVR